MILPGPGAECTAISDWICALCINPCRSGRQHERTDRIRRTYGSESDPDDLQREEPRRDSSVYSEWGCVPAFLRYAVQNPGFPIRTSVWSVVERDRCSFFDLAFDKEKKEVRQ